MQLSVQTLMNTLEQLAPKRYAFEWDHVGLQLGSTQGIVTKIYVALDVNERVLEEAILMGADFIVAHHPFIFKPLSAIRTDLPHGKMIEKALRAGIRIFAAHTNLDIAAGGVNDALALRLGLMDTEILRIAGHESLEKLVVFVPQGHEDAVRSAIAQAGAGSIGNYSDCSFQSTGTGTFMPLEGTTPFIGRQEILERTAEIRLETIMSASIRTRVIRAMLKAHPYEELAYDVYPLLNENFTYGLGRIGYLSQAYSLMEFCQLAKEKLGVDAVRVTGQLDQLVKKVAVCGGSGSELMHAAKFAGADVLVTGDLKYHEAQDALALGIAVLDAGHDATERVIVPVLCDYLQTKLTTAGFHIEVIASTIETAPWSTL